MLSTNILPIAAVVHSDLQRTSQIATNLKYFWSFCSEIENHIGIKRKHSERHIFILKLCPHTYTSYLSSISMYTASCEIQEVYIFCMCLDITLYGQHCPLGPQIPDFGPHMRQIAKMTHPRISAHRMPIKTCSTIPSPSSSWLQCIPLKWLGQSHT